MSNVSRSYRDYRIQTKLSLLYFTLVGLYTFFFFLMYLLLKFVVYNYTVYSYNDYSAALFPSRQYMMMSAPAKR